MNSTLNEPCPQTSAATRQQYLTPLANISETKDAYVLEAEMPGVTKEGLEITVENGALVLLGHRSAAPDRGKALHRESRGWDYRRAFELDAAIDTANIAARVENGVLTLHLPKSESVKPRRITVTE